MNKEGQNGKMKDASTFVYLINYDIKYRMGRDVEEG